MKKVFKLTDSYLVHVNITPHSNNDITVLFQSQWLGAKNPDELQNRYQLIMKKEHWEELSKGLEEVISE